VYVDEENRGYTVDVELRAAADHGDAGTRFIDWTALAPGLSEAGSGVVVRGYAGVDAEDFAEDWWAILAGGSRSAGADITEGRIDLAEATADPWSWEPFDVLYVAITCDGGGEKPHEAVFSTVVQFDDLWAPPESD
jgi:hypothetical protein